jgi:hypothetical protein
MKTCCRCKKELSSDCFQKNRSAPDGLQCRCRGCTKDAHKVCRANRGHLWLEKTDPWKKRPENKERRNRKTRERMARLKLENPEKFGQDRRRWQLATKYGITFGLKQALVEMQDGICLICLRTIEATTCATDHDHEKDYVRGVLCKPCNSALGLFGDNADNLRRATEYLDSCKQIENEPTTEDFEIATDILQEYLNGRS